MEVSIGASELYVVLLVTICYTIVFIVYSPYITLGEVSFLKKYVLDH